MICHFSIYCWELTSQWRIGTFLVKQIETSLPRNLRDVTIQRCYYCHLQKFTKFTKIWMKEHRGQLWAFNVQPAPKMSSEIRYFFALLLIWTKIFFSMQTIITSRLFFCGAKVILVQLFPSCNNLAKGYGMYWEQWYLKINDDWKWNKHSLSSACHPRCFNMLSI